MSKKEHEHNLVPTGKIAVSNIDYIFVQLCCDKGDCTYRVWDFCPIEDVI